MTSMYWPPSPVRPAGSHTDALSELADGRIVVAITATDTAILVIAAHEVSTVQMAFAVRHSSGFVQVAITTAICDRLFIPDQPTFAEAGQSVARGQCVAVDAATGIGTGISAADRARTARILASPTARPGDIVRPGHLVPVKVDGAGKADAAALFASDLVRRASGRRTAVFAHLVCPHDPTRLVTALEGLEFARTHRLAYAHANFPEVAPY